MLERIRDFVCGPRWIGKYFKDKGMTVFLIILLFFGVYIISLGMRMYSTDYFDENSVVVVSSSIVQGDKSNISYDAEKNELSGTAVKYTGDGFTVSFFPVEDNTIKYPTNQLVLEASYINIIFETSYAEIEFGGIVVSRIEYKDMHVGSFNLADVQLNDTDDLYNLKLMMRGALMSSNVFFLTDSRFDDVVGNVMIFFVTFLLLYFFVSKRVNPGIEGHIRAKLCFYDCLILLVFCMFGALFNIDWLVYVGMLFPFIYCNITFRHIVRVYVKK